MRKVQMHSLAGRLSFLFRKNGADRNRSNIQRTIFRKILWIKACVQIGASTIRVMETHMCIYLLPCVHSLQTTHGETRKLKTGILSEILMEISWLMNPTRTGGRIKRTLTVMESESRYWTKTVIRKLVQEIASNGNVC